MDLRDFLGVLRRRWISIAGVAAACLAVAVATSLSATPLFRADASVYFTLPYGNSASDLSQGATFTQSQVLTYAQMATLPIVIDPAARKLHLSPLKLQKQVAANANAQTVIVSVQASSASASRAAQIANAVAGSLSRAARELAPTDPAGKPSVDARIVARAVAPKAPYSPATTRNVLIAVLGGLLLGTGLAYLRELLDTRLRSRKDVESATELPILGEVYSDRTLTRAPVHLANGRSGSQREAFRRVCTNLGFVTVDHGPVTAVITSALPQEGKSSIAVNLAAACAESGARTLLIDTDFRAPAIATYTGLDGSSGLSSVLVGRASLDDVIQSLGNRRPFDVITSGPSVPNPAQLLGSDAMRKLLDEVGGRYETVLLDSAPLLAVTDAAVLATSASGAVLVSRVAASRLRELRGHRRRPTREQVKEALSSLHQVGANVLGVVVNGVPRTAGSYYTYGDVIESEYALESTDVIDHSNASGRDGAAFERHGVQELSLEGVEVVGSCEDVAVVPEHDFAELSMGGGSLELVPSGAVDGVRPQPSRSEAISVGDVSARHRQVRSIRRVRASARGGVSW